MGSDEKLCMQENKMMLKYFVSEIIFPPAASHAKLRYFTRKTAKLHAIFHFFTQFDLTVLLLFMNRVLQIQCVRISNDDSST